MRNRRQYLKGMALVTTVGATGCLGDPNGRAEPSTSTRSPETDAATPTATSTETATATEHTATSDATLTTESHPRQKYARPGGACDRFEDVDRWEETGTGTMSADAERRFVGSRSLHLRGRDGGHALVERSIPTSDLSDVDLSLALYTPDPSKVAFFVRLVDVDGNTATLELRSITHRRSDIGWFRTAPGVFVADSEVDLTRIDRLQLQVNNASPDTVDAWVDDLRAHPKPETGYVVLSWDDGTADYCRKAAPIQDEYGFPGVATIPPTLDLFGKGAFASEAELAARSGAGDDVVSHGSVGTTWDEMPASELDATLAEHKQWLLDNDFEGADFVVYPGNGFDATTLEVVGRYHYAGGMNQSGNVNTTGVYGFDPLVLPRTIGWDLDISKRVVDNAAAYRNCGILNFHRFDLENTMDRHEYEKLLAHIDRKGDAVEVVTLSDLWELRRENHDRAPDVPLVTETTA